MSCGPGTDTARGPARGAALTPARGSTRRSARGPAPTPARRRPWPCADIQRWNLRIGRRALTQTFQHSRSSISSGCNAVHYLSDSGTPRVRGTETHRVQDSHRPVRDGQESGVRTQDSGRPQRDCRVDAPNGTRSRALTLSLRANLESGTGTCAIHKRHDRVPVACVGVSNLVRRPFILTRPKRQQSSRSNRL